MRFLITLPLLALLVSAAHAGRPLVTEDAGVLAQGECECESVAARNTAHASPTENALSTQVVCGLGLGSQLAVALGQSRSGGQTGRTVGVGGKAMLIDGGDDNYSLTLAFGARWVRDPVAGTGSGPDQAAANLVLSAPLAEGWTGHLNLGPTHSRDDRVIRTTWAVAVENELNDNLGWGAESFGEKGDSPWMGTGLRWDIDKSLNLNVSLARQAGALQARTVTLGIKFAF
jgi:hypothetical protein